MAKKYKLYTVDGCPACAKAKKYMNDNKIDYEEISVWDDVKAVEKIVGKGKSIEVPIICSKNKCEIGFSKESYEAIIKK